LKIVLDYIKEFLVWGGIYTEVFKGKGIPYLQYTLKDSEKKIEKKE